MLRAKTRLPLLLAVLLVQHIPQTRAQANVITAPSDNPDPQTIPTLAPVTVSASGLSVSSNEMATPVSILEGDELVRRRTATLGETLEREPGMAASHFGAGASRPIIRGMDNARVRILSDGAEVMDASTISPDHAVALEPLLTSRIEVLRGPSALIYGGGAIGGVVNVLDKKIPTAIPENGVEGNIEIRGNTAANERAGSFEMTAGSGEFAIHAEGLRRQTDDYKVGRNWSGGSTVDGSYNDTKTGTIGLSWIGQRGYFGMAYTRQQNEYGLPGHDHSYEGCHTHGPHLHCGSHQHDEDDHDHEDHDHASGKVPYVDLHSRRWDIRGEYLGPFQGIRTVKLRSGYTDYSHDEIEGGEVSTRFKNLAHDNHLSFEHVPIAGWRGIFGLQNTRRDFSAQGEEAYIAPTLTRKNALFAIEEYRLDDWRFELGLRQEWQNIDVSSAALPNRHHNGTSVSAGTVWNLDPQYAFSVSLSRTRRLPTAEELYADGLHMATRTYERGNAQLKAETAHNIDISLRKHKGTTTFSVGAYHNQISDYIYARTLDELNGLQLIEYTQRDATFNGIEGQVRQRLNSLLGITLFGDYVRARFNSGPDNRNLPRIPAYRIGTRLDAAWQAWEGEAELYRVGSQHRVAAFETTTSGYNMLNLGISYNVRSGRFPYQFYLKANNLTDKLAYSHTSFIKNAAPLMGRNLAAGIRVSF